MDGLFNLLSVGFWVVLIAFFLFSMARIVGQYERSVLLRFGKFIKVLDPGLNFVLPFGIDQTIPVDLRTATIDVPRQDLITKDNVPVSIDAVVYFNVSDPKAAILNVQNFRHATTLLAQTLLRSVLGAHELDDMLSQRDKLNQLLQEQLDRQTDGWGIKVTGVEIKNVDLPEGMRRAMAKQAEAERERRAKIIAAEGEFQASQKLLDAATVISKDPAGLMLRTLQTLSEVAGDKNSTLIFPVPVELLRLYGGDKKNEK
ncbi:slipin family protein [Heliorestis convoluta]|uniref:Slipin family protein n=1 Tax=Heliorestis convoluta TaxID=356322 RepID=A0A5Q2N3H9_9FIRM|nr:slipin family protein [Heliorestis convoluta]QGG48419.1 slipin family protein [Heliorestis convoluta]